MCAHLKRSQMKRSQRQIGKDMYIKKITLTGEMEACEYTLRWIISVVIPGRDARRRVIYTNTKPRPRE